MASRVVFTADWHCCPPPLAGLDRREEWCRVAGDLVDRARALKPDVVIVAGDLWDRNRPTPAEIADVIGVLMMFSQASIPVVVIPGTPSHDGDGPGRMGPTTMLAELGIPGLTVVSRPEVVIAGGVTVACLPGASKAWLANADDLRGAAPVVINQAMSAALADVIRGMAAEASERPGPALLVGHLSVDGCVASSDESIRMTAEPVLGRDAFPDVFQAVCLGHIHKPQVIQERGPWVGYPGPLLRANWGEEKDDRGFWVLDLDGDKLVEAEFIPLPAARLVTIEADIRHVDEDPLGVLLATVFNRCADVGKAIVRVKCRASEDSARHVAGCREVEGAIMAAGALHFAGLALDIERATRTRVEGVREGLGPIEALRLYIDNTPALQVDRADLLDRARTLLQEVGGHGR